MPCDASFPRRLRARVLAMAIVAFGLVGSASIAFAQGATPSAAPDTVQAAPAAGAASASSEAPPAAVASTVAPADGATTEPPADTRGLDEEIQNLKKDVVDLNKDLFVLEEELLFPANTQVAVFVSMDVGDFFALDSVELKVDNKNVANYLYTEREADALVKGGVQRLFIGNLKAGEHELVAVFSGEGTHTRDYRRGAALKFEKGIGPKYIELTISDKATKQQPEFLVKEWE
jgi:hypothetical protein